MIFTAYFDESDAHGNKPDTVMSAFMGSDRQWELFNRRLKNVQAEFGFTIFHGTDFKNKDGEFKFWADEKCMSLVSQLTELVRDELTEGVVTQLPYKFYKEEFLDKLPRKMPRTSQYGICFLATLQQCVSALIKQKGNHRLSVTIEEGHRNVENAKELFEQELKRFQQRRDTDIFRTFTIGTKKKNPELMIADFLAHTMAMSFRQKKVGLQEYAEMTDAEPRKGDAGLTFNKILPAFFQAMRDEFGTNEKAKKDAYFARKQAWLKDQPGRTLSNDKVA